MFLLREPINMLLSLVLISWNPVAQKELSDFDDGISNFLAPVGAHVGAVLALENTTLRDMVLTKAPGIKRKMVNTFVTIATNNRGQIDNGPARYILHRYFTSKRRWSIQGFEPIASDVHSSSNRLPSDVLNDLPGMGHLAMFYKEQYMMYGGYRLQDIAVLAAVIETSEFQRSEALLKQAYHNSQFSVDDTLTWPQVLMLLTMYTQHFFNTQNLPRQEFLSRHIWNAVSAVHGTVDEEKSTFTYSMVKSVIEPLLDEYPIWQDEDCMMIKRTLMSMEDDTDSGRVQVADFNEQTGEIRFAETVYDLHAGHSLDVSGPQPRVMISNYISGVHMCAATSSKIYTFCCINECDGLMFQLEDRIGKPTAAPYEIVDFTETVGSSTLAVPRRLPESLTKHLAEMAAKSSHGQISIHSRLFAQFMHHAYPRECPFPSVDHAWSHNNSIRMLESWRYTGLSGMKNALDTYMETHDAQGDGTIPWHEVDAEIASVAPIKYKAYICTILLFLFALHMGFLVVHESMKVPSIIRPKKRIM